MSTEAEARNGVPSNTNPFCVVVDIAIGSADEGDPGVREGYISIEGYAPQSFKGPALSQKEAEELVRGMYREDVLGASEGGGAIAVRSEFAHIIPVDMADEAPIVNERYALEGICGIDDIYWP